MDAARVTGPRRRVLAALNHSPVDDPQGRAVHVLASRLDGEANAQNLSVLLKRMAADGIIERSVHGKRTYRLAITSQGRKVAGLRAPAAPRPEPVGVEDMPQGPASSWAETILATPFPASATEPPAEVVLDPPAPAPVASGAGHDGVDYEVLAGVLLKTALRAVQAEENLPNVGRLETDLWAARAAHVEAEAAARLAVEQAEAAEARAATLADELSGLKGRLFEVDAQVKLLERNNQTLTEQLERAQRQLRNGQSLRERITTEESAALDTLRRQLARVMVEPPRTR